MIGNSVKRHRIAVKRLHLSSGEILYDQVIEFVIGQSPVYYALTKELAYTEWLGGDYYI